MNHESTDPPEAPMPEPSSDDHPAQPAPEPFAPADQPAQSTPLVPPASETPLSSSPLDTPGEVPSNARKLRPAPQPRRRGAARERHQKRKQRKTDDGMVQRRLASVPPQLKPEGSFTMPEINLEKFRLPAMIGAGVIVVVLGLLFLSRLTGQTPETPPNAVWIGAEWAYGIAEERVQAPDALVDTLQTNNVGTVYAWLSWLKPDGTWAGRRDLENNFEEVQPAVEFFVAEFKEMYPLANLYAWISVPVGEEPVGRDIGDPEIQQTVADFAKFAVDDLGFDGVFLNIEPVWDGDADFLALLGVVRDTVGTTVHVSAAIPPDWHPENPEIPVPPLIAPGTEWNLDYKKSVALLVDELAVMAYNSGLSDPDEYAQWVAYQVSTYAAAVSELDTGGGSGVMLIVGIPTYDSELPGHDALVENIPSAIRGVRQGLEQAGDAAQYVDGLALYAEWETDDIEWAQFNLNWLSDE